jgi:putative transposase
MTASIAKTYRLVGMEDLNVKGMSRNRRLALSISDASLGEIVRQQVYKSEASGGLVVKVGRFFASSKLCSDCGEINQSLTLSDRTWVCTGCGTKHDRDWNASKNIEKEARRLALDRRTPELASSALSAWTDCKTPVGAVLGEARTIAYV